MKSATTAQCHSTYLTKHQRTALSSKNNKCMPIRFGVPINKTKSSHPLHISYDHAHFLEETLVFMALGEDFGLMAYSMYTHAKALLCRSNDIVATRYLRQRPVAFNQLNH